MRTAVAVFVVMNMVCGLAPPHGVATSFDTSPTESRDRQTPALQPRLTTSAVQSSSSHDGDFRMSATPNCDGKDPSTASVTALLSRLIRPSTAAHGVQCPIPPLPDVSQLEELHP